MAAVSWHRDISRPLRYSYRNVGTHDTYRGIKGIAQHFCHRLKNPAGSEDRSCFFQLRVRVYILSTVNSRWRHLVYTMVRFSRLL